MNVFAYCTAPAGASVWEALGVSPHTSPPYTAVTFEPKLLEGHDLIYVRLHQIEAIPHSWLGEKVDGDLIPAFNLKQLEGLDLGGAVVLVANCYSAGSAFIPYLYAAGAGAVIAAPGANFAAGNKVVGADLLAQWLLRGLRRGLSPRRALQLAKVRLLLTAWRLPDRDALGFNLMEV